MNMKKIILFLTTLTSTICFSQKAELDTSDILIGDQIQLNVSSIFEINEKYNHSFCLMILFLKRLKLLVGEIVETKTIVLF